MNHDDPLADLEARLHAWRPAALPSPVLARLLAAGPSPRRRPWHRVRTAVGLALGIAALQAWIHWGEVPPSADGSGRAPVPPTARFVDVAWTPGASLTMNLATGVPVGNLPAQWSLDDDLDVAEGLFSARAADGKLPLKVDCQF